VTTARTASRKRKRAFFAKESAIEQIIDFGHAPIFEDADVFPCIIVLEKPRVGPLTPQPARPLRFACLPRRGEGEREIADDRWEIPESLRAKMVEVARRFRKEPTPSEAILWQALRGKQLDGWIFCRQQPIGPFVVDFFWRKVCGSGYTTGGGWTPGNHRDDLDDRTGRRSTALCHSISSLTGRATALNLERVAAQGGAPAPLAEETE
jgi:hypothetical protein